MSIPLFLILATLMLVLVACGGGTQTATTSIPEATSQATPTPTAAPTPSMAMPVSPTQQSGGPVLTLKIIEIATDLPNYDRDDWKHWADDDSDCQNTRHEVLIEESSKQVTFKSDKQCQVAAGEWLDLYTSDTVTDATKLDVDHMVPLKNAHDSGGLGVGQTKEGCLCQRNGVC